MIMIFSRCSPDGDAGGDRRCVRRAASAGRGRRGDRRRPIASWGAAGRGPVLGHRGGPADGSFAGQQDSFLDIAATRLAAGRGPAVLGVAVDERALVYRARQGFAAADVAIAVVVQRMVNADASGVMFTVDPVTGDIAITINSAWGLGEAVVGGQASPDRCPWTVAPAG